ncbi:16S rRNA (guanine(966)-N(2))-methyltransferase RsmD [uncultured Jatrophihabitans sp.]|uniref:16S rRNA (guanine(966)-N(2))-methyltransferase RsmD n=1 Tax=uncultured Jatrophihabitans sp. TaxID=1610747 RepID=UPI0035C9B5D7
MRIVAGAARGRRLATPAPATRPTSDRTREALFNTLAGYVDLDGARVLDLYAGTGAVGLEALSRGAEQVVLVESNRRAVDVIRRNVETVALPGVTVVARAVTAFLHDEPDEPDRPFDLVFADPPYAETGGAWVEHAAGPGRLARDGVIVIERDARSGSPFDGIASLTPVREARYGDTVLWYGRPR